MEGVYSLLTGTVYGGTSIIVGHPFDTIAAKMQAEKEFMGKMNFPTAVKKVWKDEGLVGFYRGAWPPFFGSVIYRGLQFSIFEAVYTYFDRNSAMKSTIPYTLGLQPRVIVAGIVASLGRAVVENPFEYAKVRGQTHQTWRMRDAYKGFPTLCMRTTGLMTSFFIIVDCIKRNTRAYETTSGQFVMGGLAAVLAWILIWPLENMKNVIQADAPELGNTWSQKFKYIWRTYGLLGMYRGALPGLLGVFFRNGCSMVAMQFAIRRLTDLGFRK